MNYAHVYIKPIPIYRYRLGIILSNNLKDVVKYIPNFEDDFIFASTWFNDYKGLKTAWIVIDPFYSNSTDKVTHGIIAHEALHVVNGVLSEIGAQPDLDNDECQAYLLTYIVNEIYNFMNVKRCNI